jgi:hypothetical protein
VVDVAAGFYDTALITGQLGSLADCLNFVVAWINTLMYNVASH